MVSNSYAQPYLSVRGSLEPALVLLLLSLIFGIDGCRRGYDVERETMVTMYGFSVVQEPVVSEIIPEYQNIWDEKTGQRLNFADSYAGSEMVTNQIISGVEADVAILAIDRNADRLVATKSTNHQWRKLPYGGIVNKTPMVILVRQGNPKRIHDFNDLAKPGVKLLFADPVSSGAGQWSVLAIYGSELIKSDKVSGQRDQKKAFEILQGVWKNVLATPSSAREARTQFERGEGDALVTYELEALQL